MLPWLLNLQFQSLLFNFKVTVTLNLLRKLGLDQPQMPLWLLNHQFQKLLKQLLQLKMLLFNFKVTHSLNQLSKLGKEQLLTLKWFLSIKLQLNKRPQLFLKSLPVMSLELKSPLLLSKLRITLLDLKSQQMEHHWTSNSENTQEQLREHGQEEPLMLLWLKKNQFQLKKRMIDQKRTNKPIKKLPQLKMRLKFNSKIMILDLRSWPTEPQKFSH